MAAGLDEAPHTSIVLHATHHTSKQTMARDWPSLAKSGGLEKLKVGDLKEYLKEHGLSQTGEKVSGLFLLWG